MRGAYLLYLAGVLVVMMGLLAVPTVGMAAYGDYISTSTSGSLNQPAKVAVDPTNSAVYVTDAGGKAVKRYNSAGTYDAGFSLSVAGTPVGIDANVSNIFVGDDTNDCVWIYDKSGNLADLSGTGTSHKLGGASGTALKMPNTVRVAPSGHIFVVDGDSDKIYIFDSTGAEVYSFGVSDSAISSGTTINVYYPTGLAMADSSESLGITTQNLYLGDQGNSRVQKLYYSYNTSTNAITTYPTYITKFGANGDGFGSFLRLSDVAWDPVMQRVIVTDSLQMVGQLFQNDATMNQALNYNAGVLGYLNVPTSVAVGNSVHEAYVASNQDDSLVLFDLTPPYNPPTISTDSPATFLTYSTCADRNYTVNYTTSDTDSTTVTTYLFYDTDTSWYYGSTSLTPGATGEGLIGSKSGAPGTDSQTWDLSSLNPGTYYVRGVVVDDTSLSAESYSAGAITVPANSGFNAIFKSCYPIITTPVADEDVDGLDNITEQTLGTDPTDPDTDAGGVRDGVEVANGTDPLNGTDDLSSTPGLVGPYYNSKWSAKWKTWFGLKNADPSNASFVDVTYYTGTGGLLATKFYEVPADGSVLIDPSVVPEVISQGSYKGNIEVRTAGGRCTGYSTQEKWDTTIGTMMSYCYSCEMATSADAAQTLYGSWWNIKVGQWDTWYSVKNISDTDVQVEVDLYSPTGSFITTSSPPQLIPAKSVWAFTPSSFTDPAVNKKGNLIIRVVSGTGKVIGYQAQYYINAGGGIDFGYTELLGTPGTLMTDLGTVKWGLVTGSRDTWVSLFNPSDTLVNMDIYYYDNAGNLLGTSPYNKNVPGKSTLAFTPSADIGAVAYGSLDVTANGGLFGYNLEYWINSYDPLSNDVGVAANLCQLGNPATELYAPYLRKNLDGYDTEIVLRNPNSTSVTADLTFYDMAGNSVATDSGVVVPAHGLVIKNTGTDYSFTETEVNLKVVATGGGLIGGFANVRNDTANPNADLSDKYEGSFGGNMMK